jgi:hypothetical protein
MTTEDKVQTKIKVTVTSALSKKPPFHEEFEAVATLLQIRQAAMRHFEIDEDSSSIYYLTFNRERQADSAVLGAVVGKTHAAEFRLSKDTTQGRW